MDSVLFGNAEDLALIYQCQLFAVQLDGLTSAVADENGVAHLDFHRDTSALGRKLAFAAGNDMRNRDKDYSTVGENAVYINVWAYEPGWTVTVTENGTPLDVKQVWSKKDPLHSISYDIPRGAANNGTLTFPSTSCMHMFEVTASSASSTLEISVTDRFGNVSTESMTRPKALTTDVTK